MLPSLRAIVLHPSGDGKQSDRLVNEKNLQQHLWKHGRSVPCMVALCSGSGHEKMNVFGKPRRVRERAAGGKDFLLAGLEFRESDVPRD